MGYGLTGTLPANPFEPDQTIYDLEHYLRMRDFVKMGKRGLQRFAGECSGSDTPQLPVGPAKIRLPLRGGRILRNRHQTWPPKSHPVEGEAAESLHRLMVLQF
jgi:hypothetical protein